MRYWSVGAGLMLLTASAAVAQSSPELRTLTIVNGDRSRVERVEALQDPTLPRSDVNLLRRSIRPGSRAVVELGGPDAPCVWRLRIVMRSGRVLERYGWDVCEHPVFDIDNGENVEGGGGTRPTPDRGVPICPGDPRCRGKKK